jgi:hypothetical protein
MLGEKFLRSCAFEPAVLKSSGGNRGGDGILGEECLELDSAPVFLKFPSGNGGGVGIFLGCCISGFNWAGDLGLGYDLGSFARGSLVVGEGVPEGCMGKLVGGCGLFGDNLGLIARDKF